MNKRFHLYSGFDIPEFEHSIIADNGKRFPIGTKRSGFDRAFESSQFIKLAPSSEVPDSCRRITARRCKQFFVRTKFGLVNRVCMPRQSSLHLPGCNIPNSDDAIRSGCHERFTVAAETQANNSGLRIFWHWW